MDPKMFQQLFEREAQLGDQKVQSVSVVDARPVSVRVERSDESWVEKIGWYGPTGWQLTAIRQLPVEVGWWPVDLAEILHAAGAARRRGHNAQASILLRAAKELAGDEIDITQLSWYGHATGL